MPIVHTTVSPSVMFKIGGVKVDPTFVTVCVVAKDIAINILAKILT